MKNPKISQLYFNVLSMYESVSTSVNKVVSPFFYIIIILFLESCKHYSQCNTYMHTLLLTVANYYPVTFIL